MCVWQENFTKALGGFCCCSFFYGGGSVMFDSLLNVSSVVCGIFVFGPSFVTQYIMSVLVLQLSR